VVAAHRENFFRMFYKNVGCLEELGVETVPERLEPYWRYYFILSHLTDVFGRRVHGDFIQRFSQPASRRAWKPIVDGERLTSDEMLCGLYSDVCHRSLCGLFHLAGFDVAESKVQRVMAALASVPGP
jgi:hypothetical protein